MLSQGQAGRILRVSVVGSRGRARAGARADSLGVEADLGTVDVNPSDLGPPIRSVGSVSGGFRWDI